MSDDISDEDMGLPGPANMTTGEMAGLPPGVGDPVLLAAGAGFTPEQRRATYESLLQNPNARAFLNTVAYAEGADYDSLPYDRPLRPRKFTDYTQYPLNDPNHAGPTPSGRYQIVRRTYGDASKALGLDDFSPHTQDLMAMYLLDRKGGLDPLLRGDLDSVLPLAAPEWASLPQGPGQPNYYPGQPYKSYDDVSSAFERNLSPNHSP